MPENLRQKGVSAAWLKYFACFFMVIDHSDAIFHFLGGVAQPDTLLFYLPRMFGRMVFPIFAWFVAEGCQRTRSLPNYAKRLFLFAIVAQLPFTLALNIWGGSVIVTFFLAVAAISFYESAREWVPAPLAALLVLPMAVLAQLCGSDYGWCGVVIVFLLYLCRTKRKRLFTLAGCMLALYLVIPVLSVYFPLFLYFLQGADPALLWNSVIEGLSLWFPFYLPYYLLQTAFSLLPIVLFSLYRGQRGKGSKYFFYIFYPAHLLILYIIARCIA